MPVGNKNQAKNESPNKKEQHISIEIVELFNLFLKGDDKAALLLFNTFNKRIYLYCAKIVSNTYIAEDITQEVWERIIKLRFQEGTNILNPIGFIFTIARNLCLNHIKLQKHVISLDSLDDFRLPSVHQAGSTSVEELVNTSLNALKFEDRELLVLHMYCGYRFDEIAEMLNISPNAVWTRASRARAQLREIISRYQRNDKNI